MLDDATVPRQRLAYRPADASERPAGPQMSGQIRHSVMWVQQLLEFVAVAESPTLVELGQSLHQTRPTARDAIAQVTQSFVDKKADDHSAAEQPAQEHVFRHEALQAVLAQRRALRTGNFG
mmetsp:Transcript_77493/g.207021  ORF Transcript_77493/g.207021 Transcript_77493/m.207021 type:complete len:121 (+) Transcript_77493:326-688(+)